MKSKSSSSEKVQFPISKALNAIDLYCERSGLTSILQDFLHDRLVDRVVFRNLDPISGNVAIPHPGSLWGVINWNGRRVIATLFKRREVGTNLQMDAQPEPVAHVETDLSTKNILVAFEGLIDDLSNNDKKIVRVYCTVKSIREAAEILDISKSDFQRKLFRIVSILRAKYKS